MTEYVVREKFEVGEKATLSRGITEADIRDMAKVTGDSNPVHLDPEFAGKTRFGECIAHGLFCSGLISAVLGTKLPGPGAIYLNQSLKFLVPVRVGDTLTAEVEVTRWREDKRIISLATNCFNQDGVKVAEGEAVLMADRV